MKEDCIFCKIAAGEIPLEKVTHEDGSIVSFPDKYPKAPGHTLVIPTEHYQWFLDMPEEYTDKLFRTAKRIAKQLKEEYEADYVKLLVEGKDVPHVHVHLIPAKV
ncbi:MAG TPA: HIT domain-containing protein [Candidatus Paceibacterota bacterium]|nr:HIT domain-containing protein [Candidatus Paceibacterota bacterium]